MSVVCLLLSEISLASGLHGDRITCTGKTAAEKLGWFCWLDAVVRRSLCRLKSKTCGWSIDYPAWESSSRWRGCQYQVRSVVSLLRSDSEEAPLMQCYRWSSRWRCSRGSPRWSKGRPWYAVKCCRFLLSLYGKVKETRSPLDRFVASQVVLMVSLSGILPEAQDGGPIAYLRTGDMVTVDHIPRNFHGNEEELEKRSRMNHSTAL